MRNAIIDQEISNLRVIEQKILEAYEAGDFETSEVWREAAAKTIDRMLFRFAKIGKPLTLQERLYNGTMIEDRGMGRK